MRVFLFFISIFPLAASAQVLGGNAVYNFLKYSASPQLTAGGGVEISKMSEDPGPAVYNPALLRSSMHTRMNAVFNDHYGGISVYHLSMAYHLPSIKTNFLGSLQYFNYGNITRTDASGNEYGEFRPVDWVMQVSASGSYLEKWNYGATLKYIRSDYGAYRSDGMAMDFGVLFSDTAKRLSVAVLFQNMGTQLSTYAGTSKQDLPFDLRLGITKRLEGAPFCFTLTAQKMHRFDILYNDTAYNNENGIISPSNNKFSFDKLFRHFVFSTTVYLGDRAEVYAGYNFLRRKELAVGGNGSGLHGFSMGLAVFFGKLHLQYARAYYQPQAAINQVGISMKLNEYFGLGKFGERIGW